MGSGDLGFRVWGQGLFDFLGSAPFRRSESCWEVTETEMEDALGIAQNSKFRA